MKSSKEGNIDLCIQKNQSFGFRGCNSFVRFAILMIEKKGPSHRQFTNVDRKMAWTLYARVYICRKKAALLNCKMKIHLALRRFICSFVCLSCHHFCSPQIHYQQHRSLCLSLPLFMYFLFLSLSIHAHRIYATCYVNEMRFLCDVALVLGKKLLWIDISKQNEKQSKNHFLSHWE